MFQPTAWTARTGHWMFGLGLGLMPLAAAHGITIRNDRTYPSQDAALLTNDSAPLTEVAGSFVQVGVASGVYLGDGWVLSAAHFNPDTGGRATVTFDSGFSSGADVFRNPDWTGDFTQGNDFALLQLDSTPVGLPGVQLFGGSAGDLDNQVVNFFGYGATGNGQQGTALPGSTTGELHAGQNRIDQIGGSLPGNSDIYTDQVVFFDFDRPSSVLNNPLGTRFELTYEAMIAVGDSGGGIFIDDGGTPRLAGVHSLLFTPDNGEAASYGSIGGTTTIDGVLGWIAETTNNAVVQLGDANLNGTVEQGDLNAVLNNWGQANRAWSSGDFNGDGAVDQSDLNVVLSQWGQSNAPSFEGFTALPEPALGSALLLGAVGLRRRTR
ncbi:MAG: trypsin-like serine protease [Planctomycetota bacterium]